jgi:hypothetical protein
MGMAKIAGCMIYVITRSSKHLQRRSTLSFAACCEECDARDFRLMLPTYLCSLRASISCLAVLKCLMT